MSFAGRSFSSADADGEKREADYVDDPHSSVEQLFKTFRSIWNDRKAEFSEHNITATYIRKYLENVNAKAKISFSGDFHDPQVTLILSF